MLETFTGMFRDKSLYMEWLRNKSETRGDTLAAAQQLRAASLRPG